MTQMSKATIAGKKALARLEEKFRQTLPPKIFERGKERLEVALRHRVIEVEKIGDKKKRDQEINYKLAALCFMPNTIDFSHQIDTNLRRKIGRVLCSGHVQEGIEIYQRLIELDKTGNRQEYLSTLERPSLGLLLRMIDLCSHTPAGTLVYPISDRELTAAKEIYAPLSDLFGYRGMAGDLYLIYYMYKREQLYRDVMQLLDLLQYRIIETADLLEKVLDATRRRLEENGFRIRIKIRQNKHPGKVMEKVERYGKKYGYSTIKTVTELHDHVAATIILLERNGIPVTQTDSDAYLFALNSFLKALSTFENTYDADITNMIDNPKPNGYQSLHLDIEWQELSRYTNLELILRNEAMERYAENGGAAHYLYKGGHDELSKEIARTYGAVVQSLTGRGNTKRDNSTTVHLIIHNGKKTEEKQLTVKKGTLVGELLVMSKIDLRTTPIKLDRSVLEEIREGETIEVRLNQGKRVRAYILEKLAERARNRAVSKALMKRSLRATRQ